jgi:predicted nucleotidyltransferase component of viral defense system
MLHYEAVMPETLTLLQRLMALPSMSKLRFVGGTNLALQFGHRISVDLDFFGNELVGGAEQLFSEVQSIGNAVLIAESKNVHQYVISGVEVDVVTQPYRWLESALEHDGIRLASGRDVSAMKMLAIMNRGSRKDFVDLSFLLDRYSLSEIFEGATVKYPGISHFAMCKSLVYFEDAEEEPMPKMLIHRSWDEVKRHVSDAVDGFIKS